MRWALLGMGLLFSFLPRGHALAGGAPTIPPAVLSSFEHFSKDWMSRLEQVNQHNIRAIKPESAANGLVVGRYICYGADYVREVRPTGSKVTPYVGILRYTQKAMKKEGDNPQHMMDNPAVSDGETEVMEIFRYTRGRWVY